GRPGLRFSKEARDVLARYPWPGNVRELANVVERAVVLAVDDEIRLEVLPEEIVASTLRALPHGPADPGAGAAPVGYHEGVAEAKRELIREALRQTGGHQT